ncbi:ribonuclease H-like domain-containing protein [Tanacetum coccineum]
MSGSQDEIPPPPPPPPSSPQTPTQQTPHTVSTIKLPILKKGEYDIWAMKMEHYLAHTDYPIWEVIQNGNGPVSITTDTQGQIKVLPPRTAEEIIAREKERKARTTLLMALPEDHLDKFHKMSDAKEMWDAIKSGFGGNDESKKMQFVSNIEGLHKGYDKFQSLLSQLEIHGAGVPIEDSNQKFLRSLPSTWSQVSLIMRTKPGVDSFDDLYNNLRVFKSDIKGSTASSSSPQNVAFVSENTSSTNDVSIAYCVPNPSGQNSKYEQTSSYSLLANQSSCPQLDHEDLEQIDEYDLEEMDLKWQVSMILMRMKKFYKKTGRKLQFDAKEPVGFDKTKNSGTKDGSKTGKKEDSKALVTIDGEGVDWTNHSEEDEDYALMAYNSSKSDTKGNPQQDLKNKGVIDSGWSRHMTGNRSYLIDYEEIDGGFVAFGGNSKGGKITGKDFKIKLLNIIVLLKVLRKDNMYSVDLKNIVPQGAIENLIDLKVKVIRCDNGTEFKNRVMNQLCEMKGIKREFSIARTPQQNGVAEKKNRTLIEAARTMLDDLKLPTTFWAEAVNTAFYV